MVKAKKGDYLNCEVCGLVVVVDEAYGRAAAELLCCKKPMVKGKPAVKKKPAVKAPAKTPAKAATKAASAKVNAKTSAKTVSKAKPAAKKPTRAKK